MEETNKIHLNLIQNRGFIFNADDYMKIRTKHRIIGNLIGCPVNNPRNTSIGGLPGIFSPIEVRFLIERGFVNLQKAPGKPSEGTINQYREFSEKQLQEQREILRRKKISELEGNLEKIVAGKRRKALKSGSGAANTPLDPQSILQEEIGRIPKLQRENLLIQIPTEYPFARENSFQRDSPRLSERDELKYRVFCNLWDRGNFITSGSTFGGDFLIYPSDPLLVHASHVVHVLERSDIDSKNFIACNRLCIGVKKSCILAFEGASGEIVYLTSHWQGHFKPD
uniref:tRNA-splicing endonuclease subunit Sen34 n=1 Tax=Lutzomyia longipalpis TaxID=7200 RepID=A0A1B0CSR0_LUTLO